MAKTTGSGGADPTLVQAATYAGMAGVPKDLSKIYGDVGKAYAEAMGDLGRGFAKAAEVATHQMIKLHGEEIKRQFKRGVRKVGILFQGAVEDSDLEVGHDRFNQTIASPGPKLDEANIFENEDDFNILLKNNVILPKEDQVIKVGEKYKKYINNKWEDYTPPETISSTATYTDVTSGGTETVTFRTNREQIDHINDLRKTALKSGKKEDWGRFKDAQSNFLDSLEEFEQTTAFYSENIDNINVQATGAENLKFIRALGNGGKPLEDGSHILQSVSDNGEVSYTWVNADGSLKKFVDPITGAERDAVVKAEDLQSLIRLNDAEFTAASAVMDTLNLTSGGTPIYDTNGNVINGNRDDVNPENDAYMLNQHQSNVSLLERSINKENTYLNSVHSTGGSQKTSFAQAIHGVKFNENNNELEWATDEILSDPFTQELWNSLDISMITDDGDNEITDKDFQNKENLHMLQKHLTTQFTPKNRNIVANFLSVNRYKNEFYNGAARIAPANTGSRGSGSGNIPTTVTYGTNKTEAFKTNQTMNVHWSGTGTDAVFKDVKVNPARLNYVMAKMDNPSGFFTAWNKRRYTWNASENLWKSSSGKKFTTKAVADFLGLTDIGFIPKFDAGNI